MLEDWKDGADGGTPLTAERLNERDQAIKQLQTDVAGKAKTKHSHAVGDVTGLQAALDGKQEAGAYALKSEVPTLPGAMTAAQAQAGTSGTAQLITAKVLAAEIDRRVAAAIAELETSGGGNPVKDV